MVELKTLTKLSGLWPSMPATIKCCDQLRLWGTVRRYDAYRGA